MLTILTPSGARARAVLDDPRDQQAQLEQQVQGHRLQQQRDRIARQERRHRAARKDRVAAVVAQLLVVTMPARVAASTPTGTWNTRPIASSTTAAKW